MATRSSQGAGVTLWGCAELPGSCGPLCAPGAWWVHQPPEIPQTGPSMPCFVTLFWCFSYSFSNYLVSPSRVGLRREEHSASKLSKLIVSKSWKYSYIFRLSSPVPRDTRSLSCCNFSFLIQILWWNGGFPADKCLCMIHCQPCSWIPAHVSNLDLMESFYPRWCSARLEYPVCP